MPKASNKDIYPQDPSLDMEDYLLGTNNNTTNKKTQTYSLGSIFSLFYNFLGYNAFLFTTDTDTYPIASPGCLFAFDEDDEITSNFQQTRKLTFSSNDTYNFNVTEYLQMLVDSDKFLFKLINLEDKNNFIFLKPRNFTLSNTLTSFDVNIEIQYGLSNGNFVNYKKYLLLLEFDANTFDPADYDLTDFTNTSGNPFITAQDLTDAIALLPSIITNHSGLNLDDGTNPHGTTKGDLDLENVPNIDATNRANHTGTQLSTTISDLQETIEDTIGTKVKAGANVSVSYDDMTGETTISSTDNGEVNTASNIGTAGVGVFKQKTGANLEFKKINSGSNKVIITDDVVNNEVDINVVEANFTGIPQSAVTNLTTDISNKLDKSTTPSSVYGNDVSGNPTMIPLSNFGTVKGTGTTNYLSKFTASGTLGNSQIFDNGTNVGIGTTSPGARLDIRAQGALATDIAFRVRNSTDTQNFLVVNGAGDVFNNGAGGITENTFFGENVGRSATGSFNAFFGTNAGRSNTIGVSNSFFGTNAGRSNTTASNNSFFGSGAGQQNTTGASNVFIGQIAGNVIADGTTANQNSSNSVFLGAGIRALGANQTNQIVIGHNAIGLGSNSVVLGNTSITRTALRGQTSINTDTIDASAQLQVDSTTRGFLPPRMTTAQRNAIATPAAGLVVYDITDNKHYGYNGTTWNAFY